MNWGHILFSFSGRINRAKWWLSILATLIIAIVVGIITAVVHSDGLALVLNLIYLVLSIWISLAAGAKRLHDLNRTGAWLVFFIGAPMVLTIIIVAMAGAAVGTAILSGQQPSPEDIMRVGGILSIFGLVMLAIGIWYLVWFGCLRGTVGANNYGPDPLEGKL
jgi:uncharacterized membrane protein YhaH (DUF805 family)